jgi:Flp pilus assembly protein TadD
VVRLSPEDPEARNNLGAARFMAGDLAAARRQFSAALSLQPDYPSAVLNLCDLELQEGCAAAARDLCAAYLEHHRDDEIARRLRALQDDEAQASTAEG